jgi:hypothetical protein
MTEIASAMDLIDLTVFKTHDKANAVLSAGDRYCLVYS